MANSNKNSASEDDLGLLHGLVSKVYTRRCQDMLDLMEAGMEGDVAIDLRVVKAAAEWVTKNEIGCAPMEDDQQSALSGKLRKIQASQKGKVVQFVDEA